MKIFGVIVGGSGAVSVNSLNEQQKFNLLCCPIFFIISRLQVGLALFFSAMACFVVLNHPPTCLISGGGGGGSEVGSYAIFH